MIVFADDVAKVWGEPPKNWSSCWVPCETQNGSSPTTGLPSLSFLILLTWHSFRQILFWQCFFFFPARKVWLCTKGISSGLCNGQVTRMSISHHRKKTHNYPYANYVYDNPFKAHWCNSRSSENMCAGRSGFSAVCLCNATVGAAPESVTLH